MCIRDRAFAVENMIPVLDLALISYDPIAFQIKEIIQCDALDLALEYPLAEGLSREIPVQILDLYLATFYIVFQFLGDQEPILGRVYVNLCDDVQTPTASNANPLASLR